ncbi:MULTISPECIES: DUF47 domain-containing protein [unclassified Adlercreutzia]|uniref:DUF47 domain-containing protein n=1 Tax=unclassified Adlercreutzia TaxID=2636013 RepID=UPI0013EA4114|nr:MULTISPECIES: DUF47 family protein [unclassified Adlercreutzia]
MAKKDRFDYFDAFEHQAKLAVQEAEVLLEAIENFTTADKLQSVIDKAHEIEHQGDEINHAVSRSVANDFITPFDREDLLALAHNLDGVIDLIEDVILRFYMYDIHFMHEHAIDFAKLIKKSCQAVEEAMGDFRNFKKSKHFKKLIIKVNDCEEEGDQLYIDVIRSLHTEDRDEPMRVHVWSQIFERMERCCDACEDVSNIMEDVMLRNV